MRILLPFCLGFGLTVAPAHAQDGGLAVQTPGDTVTGQATATTLWTQAPVELTRFSDSDVIIVSLPKDAEVTLVLADGDQYRVRRGADFGWVAADQLTGLPPMPTLDLDLSAPPL
jgi:hypothetical protein